jgi:hypothetical protein
MALIDFTPEEIRELRGMIRSEMNTVVNTQNRSDDTVNDPQSGGVYVALVPRTGIPALSFNSELGTSTGTGELYAEGGDVVGFRDCEIHRINVDINILNTTLEFTGKLETVYNLGTEVIAGPSWISIHKDRWGRWIAVTPTDAVCPAASEIQHIILFGKPTGGSITLSLKIDSVSETITVAYDATAEEVEIALQTHTEISDAGTGTSTGSGGDTLVDDLTVSGGPLPNVAVKVEFIGDFALTPIDLMIMGITGLTGGIGVGGIVLREQAGRA